MIVVDSSVWIGFFNGNVTPQTNKLLTFIGEEPLLVGDLILCEVLQGARSEVHARLLEKQLRKFDLVPMLNPDLAIAAANYYRMLRNKGITVRKTIDLIIGTFCIAHQHTLLHDDRDFEPMQSYLGLRTVSTTSVVNAPPAR